MTQPLHTFHIPVMGLAFTIDTPIRLAHFGISSVVAITDDELIEKMRAFYSSKFKKPYAEITQKMEDFRAQRITHYLNLMDELVKEKFESFKIELSESKIALENYLAMLPNQSEIKAHLKQLIDEGALQTERLKKYIETHLHPGSIDVNIMTKVDKENFYKNTALPTQYNDAHAALRGFALSKLTSSLVLSAGMNPRLYSYLEDFADFYPDENAQLKKKIILKVSDFRSAMIQGNFLAKKGLWVSEYRIESGLNCGGHAFATDGYLMGPILEEFKQKKNELIESAHGLLVKALEQKNKPVPTQTLPLNITAQGGVGTAEEHQFLLDYYQLDSIGWGSPFLLVPEATSVDADTRKLLAQAREKDFYLSNISPLGVPFNTVRGTTNEFYKQKRIEQNQAGSSCPKKLLALSKEYDEKGICTASKKYQDYKLEELEAQKEELSSEAYHLQKNKITEKACLCVGLANTSYLENGLPVKGQQQGVVICPGPNLAYFDREISLLDMVRHIYGNTQVMHHPERPVFFVNELRLYVRYLKNEIAENFEKATAAQFKKWEAFRNNLYSGIAFYQNLLDQTKYFKSMQNQILEQLEHAQNELSSLEISQPQMA
ncbi:MAG: hypothetical protein JST78_01230 [Bacteroidetes bacterium]|nr:hypothetical protein [Bacteroidota bacterium]